MSFPLFDDLVQSELDRAESGHLLRSRRVFTPLHAVHVEHVGRRFVNFSSNNYLGLTHHPRLQDAVQRATRTHGVGAGAAGLITGHTDLHQTASDDLARWKSSESAVLFPSGYQANFGAIHALAALSSRPSDASVETDHAPEPRVRFLVDKLLHASLIDAVRATELPFRVFPHNHLAKLTRLLDEAPSGQLQVVVTESIFSMDGDAGDLVGLAALKKSRPFVWVVDEAHGSGVYGPEGKGLSAELGVEKDVDVTIVTLSKALGLSGGAVCSSRAFCDLLLNKARAYIYSTSVPATVAAGASEAIRILKDEPERQLRVRQLARTTRARLTSLGVTLSPGDSPILPIIVGTPERALHCAEVLKQAGLLALPIRPPTVAPNASRLRVTLSCEHTDEEIDALFNALKNLI